MKKWLFLFLAVCLFIPWSVQSQPIGSVRHYDADSTCDDPYEFNWDDDNISCADGVVTVTDADSGGGTECVSSACDLHVDTELNNQGICLADGTDCPAAGAGDFLADGTVSMTGTLDMGTNIIDNAGQINADGLAMDANENITLGGQTLDHDGTDFVFSDSIKTTNINITGLTASELLATDASKNIVSLAVATYPSPAELIHLKDVTSAIQTQIDGKEAALTTLAALSTALSNANQTMVSFTISNGDTAIDATVVDPIACTGRIAQNMKITGWYLDCDKSGSIVIDVWKNTWDDTPEVDADSIASTEKPTLTADVSASDTALGAMTVDWDAGQNVCIEIESAATVTKCQLNFEGYWD